MPDHDWKCEACGDRNPPYTEVCRNCLHSAPKEPERSVEALENSPVPKHTTTTFSSMELLAEIYPFEQIKDRGLSIKAFAFLVWTAQITAMLVVVVSFNWRHLLMAVALLVLLELFINRRILHIKRPSIGKAAKPAGGEGPQRSCASRRSLS